MHPLFSNSTDKPIICFKKMNNKPVRFLNGTLINSFFIVVFKHFIKHITEYIFFLCISLFIWTVLWSNFLSSLNHARLIQRMCQLDKWRLYVLIEFVYLKLVYIIHARMVFWSCIFSIKSFTYTVQNIFLPWLRYGASCRVLDIPDKNQDKTL